MLLSPTSLANPEQPECLLSPVACPHPLSPMSSLENHTCTALGSNWDPVCEPQLCRLVSVASEYSHGHVVSFMMISLCEAHVMLRHSNSKRLPEHLYWLGSKPWTFSSEVPFLMWCLCGWRIKILIHGEP